MKILNQRNDKLGVKTFKRYKKVKQVVVKIAF